MWGKPELEVVLELVLWSLFVVYSFYMQLIPVYPSLVFKVYCALSTSSLSMLLAISIHYNTTFYHLPSVHVSTVHTMFIAFYRLPSVHVLTIHTMDRILLLPSVYVSTVHTMVVAFYRLPSIHTMGAVFCSSQFVNSWWPYIPSLTPSVGLARAHSKYINLVEIGGVVFEIWEAEIRFCVSFLAAQHTIYSHVSWYQSLLLCTTILNFTQMYAVYVTFYRNTPILK